MFLRQCDRPSFTPTQNNRQNCESESRILLQFITVNISLSLITTAECVVNSSVRLAHTRHTYHTGCACW